MGRWRAKGMQHSQRHPESAHRDRNMWHCTWQVQFHSSLTRGQGDVCLKQAQPWRPSSYVKAIETLEVMVFENWLQGRRVLMQGHSSAQRLPRQHKKQGTWALLAECYFDIPSALQVNKHVNALLTEDVMPPTLKDTLLKPPLTWAFVQATIFLWLQWRCYLCSPALPQGVLLDKTTSLPSLPSSKWNSALNKATTEIPRLSSTWLSSFCSFSHFQLEPSFHLYCWKKQFITKHLLQLLSLWKKYL